MPQQFDPRVQQALQQLQGGMQSRPQRHPLQDFAVDLGTLLTSNATPRELVDNRDIARGKLGELQQKMAIANLKGTLEALQNQSLLENMASENILTQERTKGQQATTRRTEQATENDMVKLAKSIQLMDAQIGSNRASQASSNALAVSKLNQEQRDQEQEPLKRADLAAGIQEKQARATKLEEEGVGQAIRNELNAIELDTAAKDKQRYINQKWGDKLKEPKDMGEAINRIIMSEPELFKTELAYYSKTGDLESIEKNQTVGRKAMLLIGARHPAKIGQPQGSDLMRGINSDVMEYYLKLSDQRGGLESFANADAVIKNKSDKVDLLTFARSRYAPVKQILQTTPFPDFETDNEWEKLMDDLVYFTGLPLKQIETFMESGVLITKKEKEIRGKEFTEDVFRFMEQQAFRP